MPRTQAEALRYKLNDQKLWAKQQLMAKKIPQEEVAQKAGSRKRQCMFVEKSEGVIA